MHESPNIPIFPPNSAEGLHFSAFHYIHVLRVRIPYHAVPNDVQLTLPAASGVLKVSLLHTVGRVLNAQ